MNKLKSIITLSAIFVSSGTYGVTCSNDPNDLFDDINLNVTIDGLSPEGTSLVGNSVQITGSAFWQAPQTMRNSPLNANIYFDESKVASSQTDTTGAGATGLSITFTKPSLERGHHSFELTTEQDTNCSISGAFVTQNKPSAVANGNYSGIVSNSTSTNMTHVRLDGSYSNDKDYSLLKNNPDVYWKINNQRYDGATPLVELPAGEYTAIFTVNDGVYSASDTATVTVIDELEVNALRREIFCGTGIQAKILFEWNQTTT